MSSVPSKVLELIETFDQNIEAYKDQQYNETQLRREFIDPFFTALGWDVANVKGYAQAYKDVIHEDAIKIGGYTKAPDYCFRIGGTRKFFLEAKKPSIDIKGDPHPAYQLRRYAWSAKLPLSILTDFEEFAVYDCLTRPKQTDKAATARIKYYKYKEYAEKWGEIESVFSKEAIQKGSFDKFAATTKGKRGTTTVDKEFLAEIEKWREIFAKTIALKNRTLSIQEVNFAVQRTIDRILFLRLCEDRGIENYGQLLAISSGDRTYPRLCRIFEKADHKYNSGLFYFQKEKGRPEDPDELTLNLVIDDKDLKWILHHLYYPQCPYEFSVLPAEILGNVYEQFLGKVITLTGAHRAKIEDKPEVKKAGGIYYTPSYIVDYIVKNTVGRLLGDPFVIPSAAEESIKNSHCESAQGGRGNLKIENQQSKIENKKPLTPKQVANLRILDPACGSGSFLLGAYTYLLNYIRDWYVENSPEKHPKKIYQGKAGQWFLTIAEKKKILLNNIFGVDIDYQAVEVTKLSLLLKVLEGENRDTVENQMKLFHERALPDLGNNIKCGNSLISPDFYEDKDPDSIDPEEYRRINPFDWKTEFPDIFNRKTPGFNAVIGNPPWLMVGYYISDSLDYLRSKFTSAHGKFDMYYTFIEKGLSLLSDVGFFGMIVPNKFFHTKAASNLRTFLSKPKYICSIVDFGDEQIFSGATNYSCLLFLQKYPTSIVKYAKSKEGLKIIRQFEVPWTAFLSTTWHFEEQSTQRLFEKLETVGEALEKIAIRFGTGVQTGADRLLTMDTSTAKDKGLETKLLRPVLRGRDVRRYVISPDPKLAIFPYKVQQNEFVILSEPELQKHESVYNLLLQNKRKLAQRVWFGKGAEELSGKWYGMMYLDAYNSFVTPHLLTPALSNRANFALGTGDLFATGTAGVTSIILNPDVTEGLLYLLGLLNSSLLSFYATSHSPVFSGGYYKFSSPYLKNIPIRTIDFDNPDDVTKHDKMVKLVDRMLDLHKKLAAAKVPAEKTRLQRQITATDNQIDKLVYDLYNLTPEEIAIVKETAK